MSDKDRWRIERLAELAGQALAVARYDGQASGRVREVPDVRTIRYYTTLGLLDSPCEMRGRVAYYGQRHLLQLVAIKRLQAQGVPLVEVQRQLLGCGDRKLGALADLPAEMLRQLAGEQPAGEQPAGEQPAGEQPAGEARAEEQDETHGGERGARPGVGRARKRDADLQAGPATRAASPAFWEQTPIAECEVPVPAPSVMTREASPRGATPREATPAAVLHVAEGVLLLMEGIDPNRLDRQAIGMLQPALDSLRQAIRRAGLRPGSGNQGTTPVQPGTSDQEKRP